MFGDIHHVILSPTEEEVADSQSQNESDAQPYVVGHEDQHERVGGSRLDEM